MRIDVTIKPDSPRDLVMHHVSEMAEAMRLFGISDTIFVSFSDAEDKQMDAVQNSRVKQIGK